MIKNEKNGQIRSGGEAAEKGRRGGKASGKSRRLKKSMREVATILLECGVDIKRLSPKLRAMSFALPDKLNKKKKLTLQTIMVLGQILGGAESDARCAKWVSDLLGETTAQGEELSKVDKILSELNAAMDD